MLLPCVAMSSRVAVVRGESCQLERRGLWAIRERCGRFVEMAMCAGGRRLSVGERVPPQSADARLTSRLVAPWWGASAEWAKAPSEAEARPSW